jgi:hypothetical protein
MSFTVYSETAQDKVGELMSPWRIVNEAVEHGRGKSVWVQLQVDRYVILEFWETQLEVAVEKTNQVSGSRKIQG